MAANMLDAATRGTGIYVRVSTNRQDHKLQLRAMFDWLAKHGLKRTDCRWYRDRGVSSAKRSRPSLDRMMADARAGHIERIVVWNLDRANRWGVKDHLRWRLELDQLGIELVSLTEPDAVKFADMLDILRDLIAAEARAKWLEDHRQRVTQGIKAKRKPGQPWGAGHNPALTMQQWITLLSRRDAGERVTALAAEVGLGRSHVSRTLSRLARIE